MRKYRVSVLKLGGSLGDSPWLRPWLAEICRAGSDLIVVPGGGRFADTVRAAQQDWALPDDTAHRMALVAMAQFGLSLAARAPGLEVAVGLEGLAVEGSGAARLWLPALADQAELDAAGLRGDWSLTSDSLALWLARRLSAEALWLVKHLPGTSRWHCDPDELRQLAAAGVLDARFPELPADCPVHVLAVNHPLDFAVARSQVACLTGR